MANPPPAELIVPLTDEQRAASLRETLARAPDPGALRVFGYGSLMWKPCFPHVERSQAVLPGYHRDFSIWSVLGRGTPQCPGLGFGLEPRADARCLGILYRLPGGIAAAEFEPLWDREMWTDTYRPEWVSVETPAGPVAALTFVVQTHHRQYAGGLAFADKARYIAAAHGKYGACRDYLAETVRELADLGIAEPELEALLDAVDGLRG